MLDGPGPPIIHDFAITEDWIVFPDPSVVTHPESGLPFPYVWDDKYQAKIGVTPRDRSKGPIRWIPVDGYFMYHTPNAWESADGTIGPEGTYYKREDWDQSASWINSLQSHAPWVVEGTNYVRWTIDPVAGTAKPGIMDNSVAFDFPTVSAARLGRKDRYTYAQSWPRSEDGLRAVVKWDAKTGSHLLHMLQPGQRSARWSNAPRASQCFCICRGWMVTATDLASRTDRRWPDTAPKRFGMPSREP